MKLASGKTLRFFLLGHSIGCGTSLSWLFQVLAQVLLVITVASINFCLQLKTLTTCYNEPSELRLGKVDFVNGNVLFETKF